MSTLAQSTRALYQPFIEFRSLDWLKSALLYWEGVRRIVPVKGFIPNDPPEVKDLVSAGLVEGVTPERYTAGAADKFLPRLKPLLDVRGGSLRGTVRQNANRLRAQNEEGLLYQEKLDERLIQLLKESGLAKQSNDAFAVRRDVFGLYMTTLAGEVAADQNLVMATDDLACDVSSLYFNTTEGSLHASEDGFALARINSPFPQPSSLSDAPFDRILEIRTKYSDERREFRKKLQTMAAQLEGLPSPRAIHDVVEDQKKDMNKALTDLKQSIDETKTGLVWDALTLTVPSGLTATTHAAGLPLISAAVLGGTALTIGLVSWYGKRRGKMREIQNSPWHYLISLERTISADQARHEFENGMRALVFD